MNVLLITYGKFSWVLHILKLKGEKNASLENCSYITDWSRSNSVGKFEPLNKVVIAALISLSRALDRSGCSASYPASIISVIFEV